MVFSANKRLKVEKMVSKNVKMLFAVFLTLIIAFSVFQFGVPYITSHLNSGNSGRSITTGVGTTSVNTAQFILTYQGGKTVIINSTTPQPITDSLVDQTYNPGQVAVALNTNLDMTPSYTGTVGSYTIAPGSFTVEIFQGQVSNPTQAMNAAAAWGPTTVALQPVGTPALTSGTPVIVCSSTVNGNSPPFAGVNYQQGQTYTLMDEITGYSISGTFSDGSPFGPVTAGTAYIFWTYSYSSSDSFNGITVGFALSAH